MLHNYKTDIVALKKLMVEKGLTKICDLSKATNINRNTLSDVLSGKMQPSSRVMERLVTVLEIPPENAGKIFFNGNLHIA